MRLEVSSATWWSHKPGARDRIQIISGGPLLHCPNSPNRADKLFTLSWLHNRPPRSQVGRARVGCRTGEMCLGSQAAHLLSKSLSGRDKRRSVYTRNATLITSCCRGTGEGLPVRLIIINTVVHRGVHARANKIVKFC